MVVFRLWYSSKDLASLRDRGRSMKLRGERRQKEKAECKEGGYENKSRQQNNCKRAREIKDRLV